RSWQPRVTPKTSDALTVDPGMPGSTHGPRLRSPWGSEWRCQGRRPIRIGQPEQHTSAAPVERNYHGCPGTRPRPSSGDQAPTVYAACHVQLREAQVAQVPQTFFDAPAVRTWCGLALEALGRSREEIDAINVYPVADGDTGTNLFLTVESAAAAVEAVFAGHEAGVGAGTGTESGTGPTLADTVRAMAHGALIGARGNSGTILAQLLRGMAQVLAADETPGASADGPQLRLALRQAADAAREAVAHPVEGTVLTVAAAAADAAGDAEGDCGAVARAAYEGARAALDQTPDQ